MFTAALFTIARKWKQPRCPLTDEWIKKLWYIYTMEYYSAIKKECIWVSSTEVDEPRACCTEWSKSEREINYRNKHHILTYIWNCRGPRWGTPPMAKVIRKEAWHMQRHDQASGNPLFLSIYLQNQSLSTLLFHALAYTSDFMGGCSPPVLSEKE